MIFTRIKKWLRVKAVNSVFQRRAVVAADVTFTASASCQNSGPRESVTIGEHCTIGALFLTGCGGKITVGENTYIGPKTSIQAKESISIGKNVIIANDVVIIDNNNHPTSPEMRLKMSQCRDFLHDDLWSWNYASSAPVVIEENVWIGRDARILKGVTVGKGAIVALGAVVTHDVPEYCVVAGNPAKVVKELTRPGAEQ